MSTKITYLFIIIIMVLNMAITTDGGAISCAICITAAAAGCIASCAPLGVPQLILICAMECEVAAAYGPCAIPCSIPGPF